MFVFFRNGTSVWFHEANDCAQENGTFIVYGPRKRHIAEIQLAHVAFWCYDNQELTTYGFAERSDK